MFENCEKLKDINFNNDTLTNNLIDMNSMFFNCRNLEKINTQILKINKVTNLSYAFVNCNKIQNLDLSNFITENAKELSGIFLGYNSKEIDVSHFDTSKVTKMDNMFNKCINLEEIDISNFNFIKYNYS